MLRAGLVGETGMKRNDQGVISETIGDLGWGGW